MQLDTPPLTQSPASQIDDPQKELVDPALKGTENVLSAVNKADSVKRVVQTSSVVALYGYNDEKEGAFDESDWNKTSSLKVGRGERGRGARWHVGAARWRSALSLGSPRPFLYPYPEQPLQLLQEARRRKGLGDGKGTSQEV